jgi:hypothetical protein
MNRFYLDSPNDGPEQRFAFAAEQYERDVDDISVAETLADWDRDDSSKWDDSDA